MLFLPLLAHPLPLSSWTIEYVLRREKQCYPVCSGIARIPDYQSFFRHLFCPKILWNIAIILVGDLSETCFWMREVAALILYLSLPVWAWDRMVWALFIGWGFCLFSKIPKLELKHEVLEMVDWLCFKCNDTFKRDWVLKLSSPINCASFGHHANCCYLSPGINKIVIIKGSWGKMQETVLYCNF